MSSFSARASHFLTLLSDCGASGVPLVVAAAVDVDVALEDWKRWRSCNLLRGALKRRMDTCIVEVFQCPVRTVSTIVL